MGVFRRKRGGPIAKKGTNYILGLQRIFQLRDTMELRKARNPGYKLPQRNI